MSTEQQEINNEEANKDLMDGGFAVVDRERLIAEETKKVMPWYAKIGNLFFSPTKTMEETIEADPPKGMGLGLWVSTILYIIYALIMYLNPLQKIETFDMLRKSGIAEDKLAQQYQLTIISSCVMAIGIVAFGALITTVVLQIIRAICRDKGSFKKTYILALLSQIVAFAIGIIEEIIKCLIGTTNSILGIEAFVSAETLKANILLQSLSTIITIPNIWSVIVLVVGYKVMTKKSTTKAIVVIGILELLIFAYTYGVLMLTQGFTNMMG